MRIELNCAACGSNRFAYPMRLTNDSVILCGDCEHEIGTVEDLQQKLIEELNRRRQSAR